MAGHINDTRDILVKLYSSMTAWLNVKYLQEHERSAGVITKNDVYSMSLPEEFGMDLLTHSVNWNINSVNSPILRSMSRAINDNVIKRKTI